MPAETKFLVVREKAGGSGGEEHLDLAPVAAGQRRFDAGIASDGRVCQAEICDGHLLGLQSGSESYFNLGRGRRAAFRVPGRANMSTIQSEQGGASGRPVPAYVD